VNLLFLHDAKDGRERFTYSSSRPVTNMDVRMISHYLWRENG
jgi:hypothetical protein